MTNKIQKIIMMRHGQTGSDKTDPDRLLIPTGITELRSKLDQLKTEVNLYPVEIISTGTPRAIQTAQIISKYLCIEYNRYLTDKASEFLISEWTSIYNIKLEYPEYFEKDLTEIYLSLNSLGKLPADIKRPQEVAKTFLDFIKSIKSDVKTLVYVANGGSIEAACYYQNMYRPAKNDIINQKILGYSDYIILNKS